MDKVYDFMKKWKHIDLGQVFTPFHMALFAAKLIDVNKDDVVLDATAGTGALLFAAIDQGCRHVLGCEFDPDVFQKLKSNLDGTDIEHNLICGDASSKEVAEWIKKQNPTKAILNPPYEKKYNSAGIVLNVLNALPEGCQVALFHQANFFDKFTKEQKEELKKHRIKKIIRMPANLFQPFVSVQTAIYIIKANIPQNDYRFYGYDIPDDGLRRAKGQYRVDRDGIWENELEPKLYDIISNEKENDIATRQVPDAGYSYRPKVSMACTKEDFIATTESYMAWKAKAILKDCFDLSEEQILIAAIGYYFGTENILPVLNKSSDEIKLLLKDRRNNNDKRN